ncbi:unnamed protein product [Blepharisma stoltei]|uniref:GAF domain-containing protein n=1 Tax=Blepharisma stoltei TaxID=1481888 RepID=A0AAU9J338_9CILI|nr:unnamed protein product [Blepharisma stoltei]
MADPSSYFIEKNIEQLFETLMEAVVTAQPENPRQFLAAHLQDNRSISFHDFLSLFNSISKISAETNPRNAFDSIINETCKLLHCERASLFIHDPTQKCLKLIVGKGAKGLVLYENSGFTWTVFNTKQCVNIADVYSDPRFDCSVDLTTGFVSKSMLGVPILNQDREPIGVLLALNKKTGAFPEKDEEIITKLAHQAGISIRNAYYYQQAIYNENKTKVLLGFIKNLSKDKPGQILALDLAKHAGDLINADRCQIFLIDRSAEKLILIAADSGLDFKLPLNSGLVSYAATTGETVNVSNAYEDPRNITDFDEIFNYKTQSLMAVPIKCDDEIIGAIQVTNKHYHNVFGDIEIYDTFTKEDEKLLQVFSEVMGRKLKHSFRLLLDLTPVTEDVSKFESSFGKKKNSFSEDSSAMQVIKEEKETE